MKSKVNSISAELRGKSNSQLAFALGMAVNAAVNKTPTGAIAALAGELANRGLLDDTLSILSDAQRQTLTLRISVDRAKTRRANAG